MTGPHIVDGTRTSVTAFVGHTVSGTANAPTPIKSLAEFAHVFGGPSAKSPISYAIRDFFLNGGTDALVVRVAARSTAATMIGNIKSKIGLYALEKADSFNLLVMPEIDGLINRQAEAIAYCASRRAFMIIDAPDALTVAAVQTWMTTDAVPLQSTSAAIYFPRLQQADALKPNAVRNFPAAGAIAGLYARTDSKQGVWKAPAGTSANIVGTQSLSVAVNDHDNGTLNSLGLNCLRTFPVQGVVCWGARTARGADALNDEYKYVPVRRLSLYIEDSIYRGTQWALFEPNAEPLWAKIRLSVGAFMNALFRQGALQGVRDSEAYFVKCDRSTMTQNDLDNGRLIIEIGVAPVRPAEFVIIRIQHHYKPDD